MVCNLAVTNGFGYLSDLVSTFLSKRNHPKSPGDININGVLFPNYFAVEENRINNLINYCLILL